MKELIKLMLIVGLAAGFTVMCGEDDDPEGTEEGGGDGDADGDTDADADADGDTDADADGALLVDDFEDGDLTALVESDWTSFDDTTNNGASSVTLGVIEGYESTGALSAAYTLDQAEWEYSPFIGFQVSMVKEDAPFDVSPYAGVSYMYKGPAHTTRLEMPTTIITDYAFHQVSVPAAADWTLAELPIGDFAQASWGVAVDFDPANIQNLSYQVEGATGDTGSLDIDNVQFYLAQ